MKLRTEPKIRRGRAAELIRSEKEPEFDLRAVTLIKIEDMRQELAAAEQDLAPLAFMKGSLHRLAAIRTVERILQVVIIPPAENVMLDQQASELMSQARGLDWSRVELDPRRLAPLAAWIQLFPDKRGVIPLNDERFDNILRQLESRTRTLTFLREVVFLLQLRPDKREHLQELVTATYFQDFIIGQFKQSFLVSGGDVEQYTEWLADYLLIHPEDRQRFSLTTTERQTVQHALVTGRSQAVHPIAGRLRDAAIILGDDARIDDQGVIQISYVAPAMSTQRVELPDRPQV